MEDTDEEEDERRDIRGEEGPWGRKGGVESR